MNVEPLKGVKLWAATCAVSIGTLLITLDQFIVNVAIPTISGELGVSVENGTWVITSYVVANAITVPLTGWLTSLFGRVRLFSVAAILFAIISFMCGLSNSFGMLLTFRIFQGLVSGSLIPLSQSLLLSLFPTKRGFAMGIWGLVVMVGPAIGPVVGGWLIDSYSWRWLFNINLPLGLIAGGLSYVLLTSYESKREKRLIDIVGIFLLVTTLGSYQVMLDRGNDDDWFHSPFIVMLAIMAVIGFCFFLIWEYFHKDPVVDLSFFKNWNFTLGAVLICFSAGIVMGSLVVTPNWAQGPLGYTPLWAGFVIAPYGLAALITFPIVGIYLHIMDSRIWIALGFLCLIPIYFYFSYLPIWTPFAHIAWPRFLQGIGFALLYVPLTTISLTGISEKRMPSAAGLFSLCRLLFLSGGVSVNTTFYSRRENFFQSRYVESVIPSNLQWDSYRHLLDHHLGLTGSNADAFLYKMVQDQAYTETFLEMNYLWAWIFVILLFALFFFKSPKKSEYVTPGMD